MHWSARRNFSWFVHNYLHGNKEKYLYTDREDHGFTDNNSYRNTNAGPLDNLHALFLLPHTK